MHVTSVWWTWRNGCVTQVRASTCDHCMMTIVTYTVPHNGNVHMGLSLGLGHRHVDARDYCMMNIETFSAPQWKCPYGNVSRVRVSTCRCTWPLHNEPRDIYSAPQWKCPYGNVTRVRASTCRCMWPVYDEHGEMDVWLGLGHRHVDACDHCMMNIEIYTVPHNGNVPRVRASTCQCTWFTACWT